MLNQAFLWVMIFRSYVESFFSSQYKSYTEKRETLKKKYGERQVRADFRELQSRHESVVEELKSTVADQRVQIRQLTDEVTVLKANIEIQGLTIAAFREEKRADIAIQVGRPVAEDSRARRAN